MRAVLYSHAYCAIWVTRCWANCWNASLSAHGLGREARHVVALSRPRASTGAQVGTVRAMRSPLYAPIDLDSANCAVCPKYGWRLTTSPWLRTTKRKLLPRRANARSTVIRAVAGPPRFVLKKLIWRAEGLPSATVKATIAPRRGTR